MTIQNIQLYGPAFSTCLQRVLATLAEKGIAYDLHNIDISKGEHKRPEYLEKQPFGVVPYLDDNGFILYESRAICRYLEQKYKGQGTQLIPTDLHAFGLFEQGASMETCYFDLYASGLAKELVFGPALFGKKVDSENVKALTDGLATKLDVYDKILSKQEFIGGNDFTLADIFHLPYFNYLFHKNINLGHMVEQRPHVKAWWEKISGRSSWKKVLSMS